MRNHVVMGLKGLLLIVILFLGMAVSAVLAGVHSSGSANDSLMPLLIYCIVNTVVMIVFMLHAKARGGKLVGIAFLAFWGIQYFMTQIETLYFNSAVKMPVAEVLRVVGSGALSALIFTVSAVFILGKAKKLPSSGVENAVRLPPAKWLQRMIVLAVGYVVIYFLFGYFIAWQFADIRYYYTGSTQIVNFAQHMAWQLQSDPRLPLFQLFRGVLWSALAAMVARSLDCKGWGLYLITGFLFAVLIAAPLIFPNDYMPETVRFGHSLELFTSMFTFGALSAWLFGRPDRQAGR